MHVVLVKVGEPLPDIQAERQQRMGLLAEELIRRGHEVTWLTNTADRRDGSLFTQNALRYRAESGVRVIAVKSIGYESKVGLRRLVDAYLSAVRISLAFLRLDRVDLCVISLPLLEVAALVGPLSRLRGVTTVVDVRDLYPDNYVNAIPHSLKRLTPLVAWPLRLLAHTALRWPHARYAISDDYLRWARSYGAKPNPADRSIPLPFPGGLESPPERVDRARPLTAVFLGAFNRIIDLAPVVRAAQSLEARYPGQFRFVIAGDGEFRSELVAMAEGCASIEFPGWIGASDVGALLGEADVGLAPYRPAAAWAMGNKYFEYLWASLPILTADAGVGVVLREQSIGDCYSSSQDLAEKLIGMANTDLGTYKQRAHDYFQDELSHGQSHVTMAEALEGLVKQRNEA